MENKSFLFKFFLDDLKKIKNQSNQIPEEYMYIGTGNPLSNILIIGKEVAIDIDSKEIREQEQYKKEILNNFNDWYNLNNYNSDNIVNQDFSYYSPLYPYKGQVLKKDNGQNFGTSKTWMNYQKLYNHIYQTLDNTRINFHENTFITEVNSTPSEQTINAKTDSIPFRKEHVLNSDFFQSFPIVIISGVGYFNTDEVNSEIENIFKVNFIEKRYGNEEKKSQPYWVHWDSEKTKIVINTYQLSIGIADCLLKEIAKEIHNSKLLV